MSIAICHPNMIIAIEIKNHGGFTSSISEKLVERHPHIYGDIEVNNEEEVKLNWEKIKLKKLAWS